MAPPPAVASRRGRRAGRCSHGSAARRRTPTGPGARRSRCAGRWGRPPAVLRRQRRQAVLRRHSQAAPCPSPGSRRAARSPPRRGFPASGGRSRRVARDRSARASRLGSGFRSSCVERAAAPRRRPSLLRAHCRARNAISALPRIGPRPCGSARATMRPPSARRPRRSPSAPQRSAWRRRGRSTSRRASRQHPPARSVGTLPSSHRRVPARASVARPAAEPGRRSCTARAAASAAALVPTARASWGQARLPGAWRGGKSQSPRKSRAGAARRRRPAT